MRDEGKRRAKGQAGGRSDGANRQKEEQQGGRKGEGREQADKDSGQGRSNEEPSGKASRASKACVGSGDTHVLPKAVEGVEVERRRGRKRKDTTVREHMTDPLTDLHKSIQPLIAHLERLPGIS
jgi:hypothetical protein